MEHRWPAGAPPRRAVGARALAGLALLVAGCGAPDEASPPPAHADPARCVECHPQEAERWRGSQHDLAMQEASAATVLGDFDDALFEEGATRVRFFRRNGRFLVNTAGPDGAPADFEVLYTFGVDPLQQYLLALPGGRLQCLTVAWDVHARRWFSLYPDQGFAPGDPLHWSGVYQTWNTMCAECHSTDVVRGYDEATDTYHTTWTELDVGCQACHGPGAAHVAWAEGGRDPDDPTKGLVTSLARGQAEAQLEACAPCHARRTPLGDGLAGRFVDRYLPETLREGLYHPDGQIQDEVYVYGSFVQSKMHQRGVACTDCHEPHDLSLLQPGNALCTQCHSPYAPLERFPTLTAKLYDSPEHHFHPADGEGAACVACHMPTRTYMVVDPRRDHSFRIPRPDLTLALGTPNACNQCHADRSAAWAVEALTKWYGEREPAPSFAPTFARARRGDPGAFEGLNAIAQDPERPAIVRATALELLGPFGVNAAGAMGPGLEDPDPLVRVAALKAAAGMPAQVKAALLPPLLEDPTRAVRIEAARTLADVPRDAVPKGSRAPLEAALGELRAMQEASADMPWAHFNLARLAQDRGDPVAAERDYKRALTIDPWFLPARFNLAHLLNGRSRNTDAEAVLRTGIRLHPEEGELYYSLGLLLAEQQRLDEAAEVLGRAASLLPDRPRIHYNRGLALQTLGRPAEAELALQRAHELAPDDPDYVNALAILLCQTEEWERALPWARKLTELVPDAPGPRALVQRILGELGWDTGER